MIKAVYAYDGTAGVETDISRIPAILRLKPRMIWIDIIAEGHELSDEEIALLADTFKFHELSIEDCLFPQYQPKIEEFENYVFTAVHGIKINEKDYSEMENKIFELDVFLGKDFLITVHTDQIPQLELLFQKAKLKPQVELKSIEYLLYSIFDKLYSTFEYIIDKMNDKINEIEDKVLENPDQQLMSDIFVFKKMLVSIRKVIEPQQSIYSYFTRESSGIISKEYAAYFRDMLSNYKRASQLIDSYNQMISSVLEIYVSNVTLKLNEVMKFLTIIATIFLPALLVTSYYGMNVVPFLEHRLFGDANVWYFAVGMIMVSTVATFLYIKKKKWF